MSQPGDFETTDLADLAPAGFPFCRLCPFRLSGDASRCYRCAAASLPMVESLATCRTCSQEIAKTGQCANALCSDPDRSISRIEAIAELSGDLMSAIKRYKYEDKLGWAPIFGRLLVGWLNFHVSDAATIDLIVANPTYTGQGARHAFGHTERVVEQAEIADLLRRWRYAPRPASEGIEHPT